MYIRFVTAEFPSSDKRNIGALKNTISHGGKVKRDVNYDGIADVTEFAAPVYQNAPLDYGDLRDTLNDLYANYDDIQTEKRFLGKFLFHFLLLVQSDEKKYETQQN